MKKGYFRKNVKKTSKPNFRELALHFGNIDFNHSKLVLKSF